MSLVVVVIVVVVVVAAAAAAGVVAVAVKKQQLVKAEVAQILFSIIHECLARFTLIELWNKVSYF